MKLYKATYKGYNAEYRAPNPIEAVRAGNALIQSKTSHKVAAKDVIISAADKQYSR